MRIEVFFQFNHESAPAAVSGIEGDVADILLPHVGDLVQHSDTGRPFEGRVTARAFKYDLPVGQNLSGTVSVTLYLDRTVVH